MELAKFLIKKAQLIKNSNFFTRFLFCIYVKYHSNPHQHFSARPIRHGDLLAQEKRVRNYDQSQSPVEGPKNSTRL